MQGVLPHRFAQHFGIADRVAQIVGHLKRLADARPQFFPRLRVLPGGDGAHLGGRDEQRTGFGAVIGRQVDLAFAFPALPGTNAHRHARALCQHPDQRQRAVRGHRSCAGQHFERQHDQTVTRQHSQRLAKCAVGRGFATPHVGIVKRGQIIVHKACGMDQFQRGGTRV